MPQQIDRYRILRVVGSGGFGIVYLAHDAQLDRQVAIKVPQSRRVDNAASAAPYLREARLVAGLDHPNIVPVYDVGSSREFPCFIVSKFIEGASLAERLHQGPPALPTAVELVATLAGAIHYAHKNGLVHRDLKPGNILIDRDGRPFIVDFGLALREQEVGRGEAYVGTPAYMSPEQARGEGHRVDGRSDIFSLGVILYELITGRRPFSGKTAQELRGQIATFDPRPPRQIDDAIPKEVERICLRALAKRTADRYTTARDFAEDLNYFLEHAGSSASSRDSSSLAGLARAGLAPMARSDSPSGDSIHEPPSLVAKIVPKGLRSFDERDADFFLNLLPGPRDRTGLPENVRFWKAAIEEHDADNTFSVGLIYGPSGSGKSSLVRAGLFPCLSEQVTKIYVEATHSATEAALLRAARKKVPQLNPALHLQESLAELRRGDLLAPGSKVLIVLDQFEQWLHGRNDLNRAELVAALRQCDGEHLQSLILVRDDFYVAVNRFFQQLEVSIVEGRNYRLVDLFDLQHARKVLAAFGVAFGRLPPSKENWARDQHEFLDRSIEGLSQEGKVIGVRLALFSEMMKGRDWSPAGLQAVGGTEGVGVAFLEETFSTPQAPPAHRFHEAAARRILEALLPESGSELKGKSRSFDELQRLCDYTQRPDDFRRLLEILEHEVRLIAPVEGADPESREPAGTSRREARHFQLTHDYLVPAVREWLTRKQRESRRGRAQLLLESLTAEWNARPDRRRLPRFFEWLSIKLWTRPRNWTAASSRMMRSATRYFAVRGLAGLSMLILCVLSAWQWQQFLRRRDDTLQAQHLVQRLLSAESEQTPAIIRDIESQRELANPLLAGVLSRESSDREKLHARLALLPVDRRQLQPILESSLSSDPTRLRIIADAIEPYASDSLPLLWQIAADPNRSPDARFRAACLLARYDPQDERWAGIADQTAVELIGSQILLAPQWASQLHPARTWLLPHLQDLYRSPDAGERQRTMATALLVEFLEDAAQLAELIQQGSYGQIAILLPLIRQQEVTLERLLSSALEQKPEAAWPDAAGKPFASVPSPETVSRIERGGGRVSETWALCQSLPLAEFDSVAADLSRAGYRPNCLRPYGRGDQVHVAAVWLRDGHNWEWAYAQPADELRARDQKARSGGLWPFDIAADRLREPATEQTALYTALWVEPTSDMIDAAMYIGLSESQHAAAWRPLNENSFVPRTNLLVRRGGDNESSSVRWKFARGFEYEDCWSGEPRSVLDSKDWFQPDVRPSVGEAGTAACSAVGWDYGGWKSQSLVENSYDAHLARCREMEQAGFRPFSIAADVSGDGRVMICSTWRRPIPSEETVAAHAKRLAGAAIALLHLGQGERVWPHLKQSPDPTLRTRLIHGFRPAEINPKLLWARLQKEPDSSARQAILLSLALYGKEAGQDQIDPSAIATVVNLYETDPDPGVHSAAWFLLQALGYTEGTPNPSLELREGARRPDLSAANDRQGAHVSQEPPRWSHTVEGQLLVHVTGPVEFSMGSAANETQHESRIERLNRVRIPRSFAIGATEVTVDDFLKFQADFDYSRDYTPEGRCPITMVSFYDAMRYCRWLSEREDFQPDEMCYPPCDQIGNQMTVPSDFLDRPAYRLPTSAEWEYACRAGTTTSRPYGLADDLLSHYAWTVATPPYRARPVAQLLPNGLGLFDILGNAMELIQNSDRPFPRRRDALPRDDTFEAASLDPAGYRDRRGGAFLYQPADARSAHRDYGYPDRRYPFLGFRIVRTLRD